MHLHSRVIVTSNAEDSQQRAFAYFSFTLGMCFQVSDVVITDRDIRRTALLHCILAYFYNTTILALVINLTVGHLQ